MEGIWLLNQVGKVGRLSNRPRVITKITVNKATYMNPGFFHKAGFALLIFSLELILLASNYFPVAAQDSRTPVLPLMEAVTVTLTKQPNILLQEQAVRKQQGVLTQSQGQFNTNLTTSLTKQLTNTPLQQVTMAAYAYQLIAQLNDSLNYNFSLNKKFRNGITMGPSLQIAKMDTNLNSFGMVPGMPGNFSTVTFNLSIPLLKNRGKEATGAPEMAAESDLEASRLDLYHTVSQNVNTSVQAYWRYVLAFNRLAIMKGAEDRARQILEDVKQLVAGKLRPAADVEQLRANLDDRTAQRISSEQMFLSARKDLGVAMGLQGNEILAIPLPAQKFPEIQGKSIKEINSRQEQYQKMATDHRNDLLALKKREKSSQILLTAAQKNLLPNLDVSASVGYSGLTQGAALKNYWNSINQRWSGLNYSAGLTFTYPLGNSDAKGTHQQRLADRSQANIRAADLERQIIASVGVAIEAVRRYSEALIKSQQSVDSYMTAVDNENLKYSLGMSTILDVINMQDRLTNSLQNMVSNHQQYANAIVQLRYETATLVTKGKDRFDVELNQLVSIP